MYLKSEVLEFFDKQVLELCISEITQGKKLGVAVSGGADSIFVLYAFVDIFGASNLQVMHFNHKLRANAELEEAFVMGECARLGVSCVVGSPKAKITKHSEEAFRLERMKFFRQSAKECGVRIIAQGHHLGDVAESLLMRIMRGANLEGLIAPRAISELEGLSFVRPFLAMKKAQIIGLLESAGIAWKDDESNFGNDYLRNKVRNKVLPILRDVCDRDFDEMALLTKTLLEEHFEFFKSHTDSLYLASKKSENCIVIDSKHRAVLRALVSRFIYEKSAKLSLKSLNELLDKIEAKESFKLSTKAGFLIYENGALSYALCEADFTGFCVELSMGENILPDGSVLTLDKLSLGENPALFAKENSSLESCIYMDYASLKFPLYARSRKSGDAIEYMGINHKKKVQDIFVDKKVPRQIRSKIAIVCDSCGDLLWVPYAPPSKKVLVGQKTDVIRLTYLIK